MSTSDFKTVLVTDSVMNSTDQLTYAVRSGASSKTYQGFPSVSSSSSTLTFNVTVPSENVLVDREVFIKTKLYFTVTETGVATNAFAGGYGSEYALQSFPLNHLFTTASATINNANVSTNIQDVLPQLLQMMSQEELARYDGMTPNLVDYNCAAYSASLGSTNDVISTTAKTGYNKYFQPRGSYSIKLVSFSKKTAAGTATNDTLKALGTTAATDVFKLAYEVEITEPIIGLSPFIYGHPMYNNQALVGISAMNFVFNIDSTCKRFLSCGVADTLITDIVLGRQVDGAPSLANTTIPFGDAEMLVCFLSSQPRQMIKSKSVVPFIDTPRFITTPNISIAGNGTVKQLQTQNIQLNMLPDLFIIQVRLPMSSMTIRDAEYGCAIDSISFNLNNSSGLLSTATPQHLWALSVKNGSKQTWSQFCGQTNNVVTRDAENGGLSTHATTGSLLVLSPTDLSLPDYLSCGTIGSYNAQVRIGVKQFTGADITPEIVVMCVNSGIFSTIAGSSQIFTGILTKSMVEEAKAMSSVNPVLSVEYNRVLGGGINGDMCSCANGEMPAVKEAMREKMKMAQMYGSAMGHGVSGSGARGAGDKFGGMYR